LSERESEIESAAKTNQQREEELAALRKELDNLRGAASQAADSEEALSSEIESLRAEQESKSAALDEARKEVEALRAELKQRDEAISSAEQSSTEQSEMLARMQEEMEALRSEAHQKLSSEENLEEELNALRNAQTSKTKELEEARIEVESLKESLKKRDEAKALAERRVALMRNGDGSQTRLLLFALVVILALAGVIGFLLYRGAPGLQGDQGTATAQSQGAAAATPLSYGFPSDHSVGELFVRPVNNPEGSAWKPLRKAKGTVLIPTSEALRLEVSPEITDLSFLTEMGPNPLHSLAIAADAVNSDNLATLKEIHGLKSITVRARTGAATHEATLHNALPGVKVRAENIGGAATATATPAPPRTAPPARTITFPNRTIGFVYFRSWKSTNNDDWKRAGDAQGTVSVPEGKDAKLEVGYDAGKDLSPLAKLKPDALDSLTLIGEYVTDRQLSYVTGLTGLRRLDMNCENVTDAGIAKLAKLTGLRTLVITNAQMTNEGLRALEPLRNLQELRMDHVKITDQGLGVLSSFPHLQDLSISHADITNKGTNQLKPLKQLKRLSIQDTGVSNAMLTLLESDLPNTKIIH